MKNYQSVQYERLRPSEVKSLRHQCPIVYIPVGSLEWHGVQNPLGTDGLHMGMQRGQSQAVRRAVRGVARVTPRPIQVALEAAHFLDQACQTSNAAGHALHVERGGRPDGVLSFLRFAFARPREMLRLMTTATEALERAGAERPAAHLAAVHSGYQHFAALLVKRDPFTRAEMERLEALVERNGFYFLYRPDRELGYEYERYIAARDREAYYSAYPYRVHPVGDDDPFFFNYTKFRTIFQPPEADFYLLYWIGQTILFYGAALVGGFALLFFGLPWLQRSIRQRARAGGSGFLAYFLCLGVAWIAIRVVLKGQLPIALLDRLQVGSSINPEDFVVIPFRHVFLLIPWIPYYSLL